MIQKTMFEDAGFIYIGKTQEDSGTFGLHGSQYIEKYIFRQYLRHSTQPHESPFFYRAESNPRFTEKCIARGLRPWKMPGARETFQLSAVHAEFPSVAANLRSCLGSRRDVAEWAISALKTVCERGPHIPHDLIPAGYSCEGGHWAETDKCFRLIPYAKNAMNVLRWKCWINEFIDINNDHVWKMADADELRNVFRLHNTTESWSSCKTKMRKPGFSEHYPDTHQVLVSPMTGEFRIIDKPLWDFGPVSLKTLHVVDNYHTWKAARLSRHIDDRRIAVSTQNWDFVKTELPA